MDKNYPIMTIRDALSYYFDITTPLSQDALNSLSLHAEKEKERNSLEILANVIKIIINIINPIYIN